MIDKKYISSIVTNRNSNLLELSLEKPVMLVFLRHFGCVFCRDALRELSTLKTFITEKQVQLIFVHMASNELANEFFEKYDLNGFESISDPECKIYSSFGLGKGNFNQLFGLKSFIKGFEASMHGTMISLKQIGDGFQMPGVFVVHKGKIIQSYIHRTASDKPDYLSLIDFN